MSCIKCAHFLEAVRSCSVLLRPLLPYVWLFWSVENMISSMIGMGALGVLYHGISNAVQNVNALQHYSSLLRILSTGSSCKLYPLLSIFVCLVVCLWIIVCVLILQWKYSPVIRQMVWSLMPLIKVSLALLQAYLRFITVKIEAGCGNSKITIGSVGQCYFPFQRSWPPPL